MLYKVCRLPVNRYPLSQEWEIKARKGRQRKAWSRTIDDIFHSSSLDKDEILDIMHEGNSSFMACIEDDIRERKVKEFGKGLDSKVKLEGLVGRGNLKGTCMAIVMRELDSCLRNMNEELGRHSDRDELVRCVVLSARV